MFGLFRANCKNYFVIFHPAAPHRNAIISYPAAMVASVTNPVDGVTLSGWFPECACDKYFECEHVLMLWTFTLRFVVCRNEIILFKNKYSCMKKEVTKWLFS